MMYSKACAACGKTWHPKNFKQSVDRKSCSRECSSVIRRAAIKRCWQNPDYHAAVVEKLREAAVRARAIYAEERKKLKPPHPKTPEGRTFRKISAILGIQAAREAFGIGQ